MMRERKCDYAVVMDGNHPTGLITERDIAHWCANAKEACDVTVAKLIHRDFQIIQKDISLPEAAALMEEHGVHELIVEDERGHLVGLLSRHDVLHAVHGAYFEFLMRVVDQKNNTIIQMDERKQQLRDEKKIIEKNALKLRKLFEALPDGIVLLDSLTMEAVEFNEAAYSQLGYTAEEFAKLCIPDYCALETPDETRAHINAITHEGRDSFETVHRTKSGEYLDTWVNVVAITLSDHPYMIAVYRDITEQKKAAEALEHQSTFLRTLLDNIPDLVFAKDLDGRYIAGNKMFEHFFGANESEIIGKTDFDFVDPELAQFFRDNDKAAVSAGNPRNNEEYLKFADGSYVGMFEVTKVPMHDSSGTVSGLLGIARDITQRKLYEERLETLANYDPLTGLANRALLQSHLQSSIDKAKRHQTQMALLMFDLDRFKDINDSYGHSAGDELLQMVSKRFLQRLREGDMISRLGVRLNPLSSK